LVIVTRCWPDAVHESDAGWLDESSHVAEPSTEYDSLYGDPLESSWNEEQVPLVPVA